MLSKKTADVTGDLIDDKITDRTTKVSKTSPKKNSEQIFREKFIPPALRHKIIDYLRLKEEH